VTEPTPFGVQEMTRCAELCQHLLIPVRIVLNRSGLTGRFGREASQFPPELQIWAQIPFDKAISSATATGQEPEELSFSLREAISRLTSLIHQYDAQSRNAVSGQATSTGDL
jgi:MinD superfamily P-loop ATPase